VSLLLPRPPGTPSPSSRGVSNALGATAQGSPHFCRLSLATPPPAPYRTSLFSSSILFFEFVWTRPPRLDFFLIFPHTPPTLRMSHFTYPRISHSNHFPALARSLPCGYLRYLPLQNAHRTSVSPGLVYSSHLAYPMTAYPMKYLKIALLFTSPCLATYSTITPSLPYGDLPYEIPPKINLKV
jgi:hypothetical protein